MRRIVFLLCWLGGSIAFGQAVDGQQRQFVYEGEDVLPKVLVNDEAVRIHSQGLFVTNSHFLVTGRLETKPKRALFLWFDRADSEKYEYVDITPEEVDGETLDHPGGFDVAADGTYWIPLSTSHRKGPSKICQYEVGPKVGKLKLTSSFEVDDHIGAVCCLADGTIIGANWDTKDIYAWSAKGESLYRKKQSKIFGDRQIAVQDWKRFGAGGSTVIMGGLEKSQLAKRATIAVADLQRFQLKEIRQFNRREGVSRPITNEGLAVHNGKLFLLPEDVGAGAKVLRYRITAGN